MPTMDDSGKAVSRFEFWPTWFFYTPVVLQSLWYGVKYRDFRLPLVANPHIKLSGMVGESKQEILELAGDDAKQWIPPFVTLTKQTESERSSLSAQWLEAKQAMINTGLDYPVVAKPDQGCRGVGVQLVASDQELQQYIASFPDHARYMLQKKSPYQAEAGLFYIRYPNQAKGKVFSITLKYSPVVVGTGKHTLRQLIEQDPRASQLAHLYLPRHQDQLEQVLDHGKPFQLAFAGSHSRGCIFKNGNAYITDALAEKLDQIFDDYPGYHFGRLDVKFKDIDSLMQGKDFDILEMNGASSEAGHIWDSNTPLKEIFSTLLYQYRCLYEIGALQRKAGHKVPTFRELFRALKQEKQLIKHYPATD
ncbi:D-alanine--D-alanine ligase [Vibrio litoralis]|uniref:D-alanine--D-alanine ligase n=1 Tax=Vibrio litoralis TaxID=335972 RepID=UPI00384F74A2